MKCITLPLTNVFAKGDYTATLYIGSEQTPINLIIDTGSSTLVLEPDSIKANSYNPHNDTSLTTTAVVQEVNYGIGGWAGALVHSQVHFFAHDEHIDCHTLDQSHQKIADVSLALVEAENANTFGDADGILGMAFHHLNKSFDLSGYFAQEKITPALSFPWPFSINTSRTNTQVTPPDFDSLRSFKTFLWQYPEHDVKPFFTQLASQHLVDNKFAFYAKRSSVHVSNGSIDLINADKIALETIATDPLNQGKLILGGDEQQTNLYQGPFSTIKVLHDVYYNVELQSVQVGDNEPIIAEPLATKDVDTYFTNAIVDTGASLTVLTYSLYQQVIKQLSEVNPKFAELLTPFADIKAQYQGIDANLVNLAEWPEIKFTFTGIKDAAENGIKSGAEDDGENSENSENSNAVTLTCPPECYWQINTPAKGKACFKLLSQLPQWPNQTLIGLPLITNYYTIFDRSVDKTGVIKFAKRV